MNLHSQHLSDEALAAYADGVLGNGARMRASRHVADCPECALAVAEQRAAVWALRAAPAPSLPIGLMDRLRELPSTTTLTPCNAVLAPDGSAVFPALGTQVPEPGAQEMSRPQHRSWTPSFAAALVPGAGHGRRALTGKRAQHAVLATAAIAFVSIGVAASSSAAAATGPQPGQLVSRSGVTVQPAAYVASTHR
jgi:anti-sigma factor RsiW